MNVCWFTTVVQDGRKCAAKTKTVLWDDAWFLRSIAGRRRCSFSGR